MPRMLPSTRSAGEWLTITPRPHMVQAHKDAVTLFQNEAKNGKDGEARAWAEKTLPTLQEHLKMATEIHAKLGKGK
jgi:predicted outer membrane protein